MRLTALALMVSVAMTTTAADDYVFENLGVPTMESGHALSFTTQHPDGYWIAWAPHEAPDFQGLFGVRLDSGEYFLLDLSMFGSSHVAATAGRDGSIYAYVGSPSAHFLRIDPATREVTDLGAPAENASYFSQGAMGPDGRYWVGSYPRATLVWVDTNTGETGEVGRLPSDERNKYQFPSCAVSDDNIVYCPVGLHHQELYAYSPATGEKAQILPAEITALAGSPRVWKGADGQVYGRSGSTEFLCTPNGIKPVDAAPGGGAPVLAGDESVSDINSEGVITLTHVETGQARELQTQYLGRKVMIYCVATQWDGKIWGGNGFPARVFSYDPATGAMVDHGKRSGGRIQVYDIIGTPAGLLISAYTGATLNLWNPNAPEGEQDNIALARGENQERPLQWVQGPDGHYYIGTRPIKGHVGGGLCRVTLDPPEARWWIDPIGAQSVQGCAPVPETGELLCVTSHYGGSSSIPTEPEGHIFLWSCAQEQVTHIDEPIPGAPSYSAPARAQTGIIYMLASTPEGLRYLGYDPVRRETVHIGERPGRSPHFPSLHEQPVGPEGLIVGLIDDAVWAIDPADRSARVLARHDSIADAHGFMVTEDGVLYYGSEAQLWRCRLFPEQ
ncbi:MAG: hypothetical protein AB7Y46_04080 [Armatimonadota bacterium]